MGCASSGASAQTAPPTNRRRLSVGHVEQESGGGGDVAEEDRGLITQLNEKSVLDLVQDDGRKMSIGSQTDQGKTSFANKSIQALGEQVDHSQAGLGFTCRKGLKPEAPNQDSWFILKV